MAIKSSSTVERPDHTRLQAGSEGAEFLQSGQKIVTRGGATAAEADFDIESFDVTDKDFVLTDEKSDQISGNHPDTGGTSTMVVMIESSDDVQFSIEVEFIKDDGTTLVTVDQYVDSDMLSTSPSNGNHYVFFTLAMASDIWDLKVVDESGGGQNNINGSINVH